VTGKDKISCSQFFKPYTIEAMTTQDYCYNLQADYYRMPHDGPAKEFLQWDNCTSREQAVRQCG